MQRVVLNVARQVKSWRRSWALVLPCWLESESLFLFQELMPERQAALLSSAYDRWVVMLKNDSLMRLLLLAASPAVRIERHSSSPASFG